MKYRLLKPLGRWPAGTMAEYEDSEHSTFGPTLRLFGPAMHDEYIAHQLAYDSNWFEEAKPFVPKRGEDYWYVTPQMKADRNVNYNRPEDEECCALGNCFEARKQAEACAVELRKFLHQWREDHL